MLKELDLSPGRSVTLWMPRPNWQTTFFQVLLASAVLVILTIGPSLLESRGTASLFVLTPGFKLGVLLLTPRRRWVFFVAAFVAVGVGVRAYHGASIPFFFISELRYAILQVVAAYFLSRNQAWLEGRDDRLVSWGWVILIGVILLPAAAAASTAWWLWPFQDTNPDAATRWRTFLMFFSDIAFGTAVTVPIMVRLRPMRLIAVWRNGRLWELLALTAAVAAISAVVFTLHSVLLLFLLPPVLLILLFRQGFVGLATGMLVLVPIALLMTYFGSGPLIELAEGRLEFAMLACKAFLILTSGTGVLVAALLFEREQLRKMSAANVEIYEMIAHQSGDVILVLDEFDRPLFASPTARELLGWPVAAPPEFKWPDLIPAEDVTTLRDATRQVRKAGEPIEVLSRAEHADGHVLWLEIRMRPSRTGGSRSVPLVVCFVRDVTARQTREQELETMASRDPLTGLANRRKFDDVRETEWQSAAQERQSLSLLMIDIDMFKAYNDTYGHQAGDHCLVRVAQAISRSIRRYSDFCARIGGEEFVVLLPGTSISGAKKAAEDICHAIRALGIDHVNSPHGVVTASVGLATTIPSGEDTGGLFDAADDALYRAKDKGRNRIEAIDLGQIVTIQDGG